MSWVHRDLHPTANGFRKSNNTFKAPLVLSPQWLIDIMAPSNATSLLPLNLSQHKQENYGKKKKGLNM